MTNPLREVVADALPELLPCPFCGATRPGIALHSTLADRCFRVLCICGAEGGPWGKRDDEEWGTYEEAIAAWNRRATLQTQSAGVEERARDRLYVSSDSKMIEAMVARFLSWQLPKNFSPDAGIQFKPLPPPVSWPSGTNLLNADQAREMLLHMFAGFIPPSSRATEEEGEAFVEGYFTRDEEIAAALRTPASEGDGGRVVEWQIMRPAFVTADENYSGKRVAAVYADASMIGQRVRLIFDTTPPTQQEARAVGDAEILAQAWDIARNSGTNWNLYTAEDFMDAVMAQARAMNTQPGSPT